MVIFVLTIVTQIGGLAWLLTLLIKQLVFKKKTEKFFVFPGVFVVLYSILSLGAYFTAPLAGREALPCFENSQVPLKSQSIAYCLLNRNYVQSDLKDILEALAVDMEKKYPGTTTLTLDGGFPFFDGFPLLPHLSHHDGRKVDLAFYYQDEEGNYLRGETASLIGYWAFEKSMKDKSPCKPSSGLLSMRWDMGWFQIFNEPYTIDKERTAEALRWLTGPGRKMGVKKIFIEPHLVKNLNVTSPMIRFQGCKAARHDDHIHFQM